MRHDVLREFACRGLAEPVRLNAYVSFDADWAEVDASYRDGQHNFYSLLRNSLQAINMQLVSPRRRG